MFPGQITLHHLIEGRQAVFQKRVKQIGLESRKIEFLQPGMDHAHYYLGVIYKTRGEADKARQELEQVIRSSAHMMLKNQAKIQLQALSREQAS